MGRPAGQLELPGLRRHQGRLFPGRCMKALVVGSGLAGVTVAEGLAKAAGHEVTLVTAETNGYYSRPRLSHGVAVSDEAAAKIVMKRFDALNGVRVLSGANAWRIER